MKIVTPALVVYLMAADDTPDLVEAAVRGGATAMEFGIPYSDPLADGPTIQRAGQRSLDAGMTPPKALELLAEIDRHVDVPGIPMACRRDRRVVRPRAILHGRRRSRCRGPDRGRRAAPEESGELRDTAAASGIDLVHLVAPTSRDRGCVPPPAPAAGSSTSSPRWARPAPASRWMIASPG